VLCLCLDPGPYTVTECVHICQHWPGVTVTCCLTLQAVVGAGAAGLVAARELRKEGHNVVVFEQQDQLGGTWLYTDQVSCVAPGGNIVFDLFLTTCVHWLKHNSTFVACFQCCLSTIHHHGGSVVPHCCAYCRLRVTPWVVSLAAHACTAVCTRG
jgi:cation diffusion facilitator CzcD-associated flavoprotein CzcO